MSLSLLCMTDLDLQGKRVLIREDLNVPIQDGVVTSDARIRAAIPTIEAAVQQRAKVILMSHLGRPTEGQFEQEFSMQPVADHLSGLLGQTVKLVTDWSSVFNVALGEVVLLENVRFNQGEKKDSEELAKAYADLCDIFVMDAFGTAHRAQASTHGVAKFSAIACAGPLLVRELNALKLALAKPKRPMVAIVGGSKVSTKLSILKTLVDKVDQLIVGGGIANTFLVASGKPIGASLCERGQIEGAKRLMTKANIPLPIDVVTAKEFSLTAKAITKTADEVLEDDQILDIGPESLKQITSILKNAKTILWNGPLGVFEFDQFGTGTKALSIAIAESDAFSLAGGGDTLAAIDKYGIADKISYISTGGGAFLEYVEGKTLPAVAILEQRAKS